MRTVCILRFVHQYYIAYVLCVFFGCMVFLPFLFGPFLFFFSFVFRRPSTFFFLYLDSKYHVNAFLYPVVLPCLSVFFLGGGGAIQSCFILLLVFLVLLFFFFLFLSFCILPFVCVFVCILKTNAFLFRLVLHAGAGTRRTRRSIFRRRR